MSEAHNDFTPYPSYLYYSITMVKSPATAKKDKPSNDDSLALLDKELQALGTNPLYDALLSPIRQYISNELNKALNQLKADVIADISTEVDKAMKPIFSLVDKLPSNLLKQAIKTKLLSYVNQLKSEFTANE